MEGAEAFMEDFAILQSRGRPPDAVGMYLASRGDRDTGGSPITPDLGRP